ncbi:MAG: potassium-transporting ATPase subunit KdpA [Bacteroidota bacterium]
MHPGIWQALFFLAVLLLAARPLGLFMARVFRGERTFLTPLMGPVERLIYRGAGIDPAREMDWRGNALAMLVLNGLGGVLVYLLQRVQHILPLNPGERGPIAPDMAFNTAISFVSNTNWQAYAGETTMSHLTQMAGLTVQNFLSAATGMAVLALTVRGLTRHSAQTLGNFWVDMTRSILYVLLPLSFLLALALVSQGVVQTLGGSVSVAVVEQPSGPEGREQARQVIALGPVASQVAIKQLGTNGGGFFNANSAHPLENPTPFSGFLEMLAILLIPAALCHTFGAMAEDARQGRALLAAMVFLFVAFLAVMYLAEQGGNPAMGALGVEQEWGPMQGGGNMEGKEARFGIAASTLWATATTAASCGSVNCAHESLTPLGGMAAMVLMQLGEVVFGGVGSGLYGMLVLVVVAVFIAGLLVGRTPEYMGHKIEVYEMTLASLCLLLTPLVVLLLTALAVGTEAGTAAVNAPGAHGFSEVLYAFSSQANNNGSAFGGLDAARPFYLFAGGAAMLVGRYWTAILTLALAGSLGRKKRVPSGEGTLPTHAPLFVCWLVTVILVVGALSYLPALALGPLAEHLMMNP